MTDPAAPVGDATRPSSFRAAFVQTTGTNLALAAIGVATGVLTARMLGPSGRGELAAIITWPTIFGALAVFGLPDALVYFSAKEPKRASSYLGTAVAVALLASPVFMVVGWFLLPVLLGAQSSGVVTDARWYLLSIPVVAVGTGLVSRPLRGVGNFPWWNALRVVPFALWLAVVVWGVVTGNATAAGLALAWLVLRGILAIPMLVTVRWKLRGSLRPDRSLVGPMTRYSWPLFVTVVPRVLNISLDQALIAAFLPAEELGIYVVAVAWSRFVNPVQLAFANVLFPKVASASDPSTQRQVFARGCRLGLLSSFLLTTISLVLTPVAVPFLFGADFDRAVGPSMVLVLASLAFGANWVVQEGFRGLGHTRSVMWAELSGLVVTAGGLAVLVGPIGIMGGAIATVTGYWLVYVVLLREARRLTGLTLRELTIATRSDLAAVRSQIPKPRKLRR